jgi:NADH:ubiquinone oxidoreductase subunit 3 (subunit A)
VVELSPEIVALLILLGGIVAAVVFTLVIVVAVDPSDANPRSGNEGEKVEERETESG